MYKPLLSDSFLVVSNGVWFWFLCIAEGSIVQCSPFWLRNVQTALLSSSKASSDLQERGLSLVAVIWYLPEIVAKLIVLIQEQTDCEGTLTTSIQKSATELCMSHDMIVVCQRCPDPKCQTSSQSWELRITASQRRTCSAVTSVCLANDDRSWTVHTSSAFGCGMGTLLHRPRSTGEHFDRTCVSYSFSGTFPIPGFGAIS